MYYMPRVKLKYICTCNTKNILGSTWYWIYFYKLINLIKYYHDIPWFIQTKIGKFLNSKTAHQQKKSTFPDIFIR